MSLARLAYAQARMQARLPSLPSAETWRTLQAARSLPGFLQWAREGPLRPWVLGLSTDIDAHRSDRAIRQHFRGLCEEVAGWLPAQWRPAIRRLAHLPDLAAGAFLARGNPAPAWLLEDPATASLVAGGAVVSEGSGAEWIRRWFKEMPKEPAERKAIARILRDIRLARSAMADGEASGRSMELLEGRLRHHFRRLHHRPSAAVAFLALAAITLIRLQGALDRRILFPPQEGAP